jgi:hypothetical protein
MNRLDSMARGMSLARPFETIEIPSLEGKVSDEEWALRVDLAAAYRMIADYGWDGPLDHQAADRGVPSGMSRRKRHEGRCASPPGDNVQLPSGICFSVSLNASANDLARPSVSPARKAPLT